MSVGPEPDDGSVDRFLAAAFPQRSEGPRLAPGQEVEGYKLRERLASGSMGEVWRAEQIALGNRSVAMKFVLPQHASERGRAFFAREARAASRINHPGIVAVLGSGSAQGIDWIAMELVHGSRTVRTLLDERQRLEQLPEDHDRFVARLVARVAEAMQVAHAAGVVHRDLKPANILLTGDDRPKVTDFGLARLEDESQLSRSGEFAGTYSYASPEQIGARRSTIDHRTDIFSLGVILYELLTLQRPFLGDTTQQIAAQIIAKEPSDPRSIRSRVPRDLAVIVARCIEKDHGRRFQTMADLAAELRRHLEGEPIVTQPLPAWGRALRWISRNRLKSAVATLAMVLVATVLATQDEYLQARAARRSAALEERIATGFDRLGAALFPEAREAFEQALEMAPESPDALAGLALGLVRSGDSSTAAQVLRERGDMVARYRGLGELLELAETGSPRGAHREDAADGSDASALDCFLEAEITATQPEAMPMASIEEMSRLYRRAILTSERARPLFFYGWVRSFLEERARLRANGEDRALPEALEVAEVLRMLRPQDPRTRLHVAMALQAGGQVEEALEEFEALGQPLAEDPVYWSRLSSCLVLLGRKQEAIAACRRAVELGPASASAHVDLGNSLDQAGDREGALASYRRAVELDPSQVLAFYHGANSLAALGRNEEAIDWLNQAVARGPSLVLAQYNLGSLLRSAGLLPAAQIALRAAIEADPELAEAHCNLASTLASLGRFDEAHREYELCNELGEGRTAWPYDSAIWVRDSQLTVQWRGVVQAASEGRVPFVDTDLPAFELLRVIKYLQGSGHETYASLIAEGINRAFDRDVRKALPFLERARAADPRSSEVCLQLSHLYLNTGRPLAAMEAARDAIELDPGEKVAHLNLSGALLQQGRFESAATELEIAAALCTPEERGAVQKWLEDYEEVSRIAASLRDDPDAEPDTEDDRSRIFWATACHGTGLHGRAVAFFERLFAGNPALAREELPRSGLVGPLDLPAPHRISGIVCALEAARSSAEPGETRAWLELAGDWLQKEIENLKRRGTRIELSYLLEDARLEPLRSSQDPRLADLWEEVRRALEP